MFSDVTRCARLAQGVDLDRLRAKAERQHKIRTSVILRELESIAGRLRDHAVKYRECYDRGREWERKFNELKADVARAGKMKPSEALDHIDRIIDAEKYK